MSLICRIKGAVSSRRAKSNLWKRKKSEEIKSVDFLLKSSNSKGTRFVDFQTIFSSAPAQNEQQLSWGTNNETFEENGFIESEKGIGLFGAKDYCNLSRISTCCHTAYYNANEPSEDRFALSTTEPGEMCAGVFDGHCGWQAAEFAQKHLINCLMMELKNKNPSADSINQTEKAIKRAFRRVENEFIHLIKQAFDAGFGEASKVGSCALIAYIKDKRVFVANLGDCRAVIGRRRGWKLWDPISLSSDHNIREPYEQHKLRSQHPQEDNVFICNRPGVCYVKGFLQPTRSLGDAYLKYPDFNGSPMKGRSDSSCDIHVMNSFSPPYITAQPEIVTHDFKDEDEFLIVATDGLWDFLSNDEAVGIVAQGVEESDNNLGERLLNATLEKAAKLNHLSVEALKKVPAGQLRRSIVDDTTIVVIKLKDAIVADEDCC
mmetsp:Transcript_26123/g.34326  ORF Transcript_26123/g.34326 Transcript_26123/m.34326 type:complete len:432 (-) Transcript_26123:286-1581(-)